MPTKCVAPHMLENSEWCSHTHTMLLPRNTRFTQQTLMQPLYVTLFIMLRGYRDSFQIAGAKTATQQIRNRLGAPTRKVSSSVGVARLRRTRVSFTYVPRWLQPRFHSGSVTDHIVASKNSVSLTFHGPFAFAALDSCANNGTNGYRSTVISPHFVRLEDQ